MLERFQDSVMLGAGADQMPAAIRMRASQTEHREIIRFRAAAGKNQFVRLRREGCESIARVVDRGAGLTAGGVNARRIAVCSSRYGGIAASAGAQSGVVAL